MTTTIPDGEPAEGAMPLALLKMDVRGRVRMPARKREAILDAFEASGMSGQAFAEHLGLKYSTFATWVQKRRRACEGKAGARAPLPLVEAVVEAASAATLEVEAPGGIKLRVGRREDIAGGLADTQ